MAGWFFVLLIISVVLAVAAIWGRSSFGNTGFFNLLFAIATAVALINWFNVFPDFARLMYHQGTFLLVGTTQNQALAAAFVIFLGYLISIAQVCGTWFLMFPGQQEA